MTTTAQNYPTPPALVPFASSKTTSDAVNALVTRSASSPPPMSSSPATSAGGDASTDETHDAWRRVSYNSKPKQQSQKQHPHYESVFSGLTRVVSYKSDSELQQHPIVSQGEIDADVAPVTAVAVSVTTSAPNTTTGTPNSHHHDSDCGSSSGLGGTNNCSSDSSMLDNESRDSGGGSCAGGVTVSGGSMLHRQLATLTPANVIAVAAAAAGVNCSSASTIAVHPFQLPFQPIMSAESGPLTPLAASVLPLPQPPPPHVLSAHNVPPPPPGHQLMAGLPLPPPPPGMPIYCARVPLPGEMPLGEPQDAALRPWAAAVPPNQRAFYTLSATAAIAAAAIAHGYQVSCGGDTWQNPDAMDDVEGGADAVTGSQAPAHAAASTLHGHGVDSNASVAGERDNTSLTTNGATNPLPPGIAAQLMRGHDLFVHILPGDVISLAVGKEIQHIPGPATIRMVSPSAPPSAIPMSVPRGHMVHQLLDKNGMLSHIIMSKEGYAPPSVSTTPSNATMSSPQPSSVGSIRPDSVPATSSVPTHKLQSDSPLNGAQMSPYAMPPPLPPTTAFSSAGGQPIAPPPPPPPPPPHVVSQPPMVPVTQKSASSLMLGSYPLLFHQPGVPPSGEFLVDPNALHVAAAAGFSSQPHHLQHQSQPQTGVLRKWTPAGGHTGKRGSTHTNQSGASPSIYDAQAANCRQVPVGFSQSESESNHYGIEDDERERLCETLNSVQAPKILRVGAREAIIAWQEIDTSEAAAPGGPFPQIDASEFVYDIYVYDGCQTMRCIFQHRCTSSSAPAAASATNTVTGNTGAFTTVATSSASPSSSTTVSASAQPQTHTSSNNTFSLTRLKPASDYLVNIRASLPERELCGNASPQTSFRTLACAPDAPLPPKILQRQSATALTVGWCQPCSNGAPILSYLVQIAKNKSEHYETVFETTQEYWRATSLESNAFYSLRVLARNELGCSEPSASLALNTNAAHPAALATISAAGGASGMTALPLPHSQQQSQSRGQSQQQHHHTVHHQQQQQIVHHMSYPQQPAGSRIAPLLLQQQHAPSKLSMQKPPTPTVLSVSARGVRLSWSPINEFHTVTLEMCDFTRSNPNLYNPVPEECYAGSGTYASINGLQCNREYRFRLSGTTANGETLLSDYVSVKTYKDRYENSALSYQNVSTTTAGGYHHPPTGGYNSDKELRIPVPVGVQRIYDDERTVEISWRYSGRDYDNISFVVEGSTAAHPGQLPLDDAPTAVATASASQHPRRNITWRVCYRGTSTTASIQDVYLCAFRVQAVNTRRQTFSAWSEVLFVKRVFYQKRQQRLSQQQLLLQHRHAKPRLPQQQSYHIQHQQQRFIDEEQQQQSAQLRTQQQQNLVGAETVAERKEDNPLPEEKHTKPPVPPSCAAPKFSATTHCTTRLTWRPLTPKSRDDAETTKPRGDDALLYELQRVDRQPPIIVYSGNETEHELTNLKPAEHLQMRVRAVLIDANGQRTEGEWSAVGSACIACAVTSPPEKLCALASRHRRLANDDASASSSTTTSAENSPAHALTTVAIGSTPTTAVRNIWLMWEPPVEVNGAAVVKYIVSASRYAIESEVDDELTIEAASATPEAYSVLVADDEPMGTVVAPTTEFHALSLTPAQRYVFRVRAINEAGTSESSNQLEVFSTASAPDAPKTLLVEPLSGALVLSWSAPCPNGSRIIFYHIAVLKLTPAADSGRHHHHHREQVGEFVVDADVVDFKVEDLDTETTYEVLVSAENAIGRGAREKVKCTTLAPPPAPPTLSVMNATANALKLKWTAPKDTILYYQLEKENENGTFSRVYEGELHSAKVKGLRERTTHRFRIRAAAARNYLVGVWSPIYDFSTTCQPPPGLKSAPAIGELAPGVFLAEWQAVRCATLAVDDETLAHSQLIYRLQVASKILRDKTTSEPWRTVYEGSATTCTVTLGSSLLPRQVRVLVAQKWTSDAGDTVEEAISVPSPITVFPAVNANLITSSASVASGSADSSPKKRVRLGAAANGLNATHASVLSKPVPPPPGATAANKISLFRRVRRLFVWIKRTVAENQCAIIVLAAFIMLSVLITIFISQYMF